MNVDDLPDVVYRTTGYSGSQELDAVHTDSGCSRLSLPQVVGVDAFPLASVLDGDGIDREQFKWCSECVTGGNLPQSPAFTTLRDSEPGDIPP